MIVNVPKSRIEVQIFSRYSGVKILRSAGFIKFCKNNEEQFLFQIRPAGSLTTLAPMEPQKIERNGGRGGARDVCLVLILELMFCPYYTYFQIFVNFL